MGAGKAIVWTPEMIKFLQNSYQSKTNKQLATDLCLGLTSVRMKCYELGLLRMTLEYWTEEQVLYLLENYKTKGDKELAQIFNQKWLKQKGWTLKHIEKKRKYLKLKRTPEELILIKEGWKAKGSYILGSQRTWQTRGAKPLGTIVTWQGDKFIKTGKGYIHLRVFNYKVFIGKITKGLMVSHKDCDKLNCDPSNLEQITRAQNALKNNWSRYSPEMRKTILLLSKINKTIKKKSKLL